MLEFVMPSPSVLVPALRTAASHAQARPRPVAGALFVLALVLVGGAVLRSSHVGAAFLLATPLLAAAYGLLLQRVWHAAGRR